MVNQFPPKKKTNKQITHTNDTTKHNTTQEEQNRIVAEEQALLERLHAVLLAMDEADQVIH